MRAINSLKNISILLCFLLITSCYKSLDFNQIEDYKLKPVLTAALTFFKVNPFQFFDGNGVQQNSITEIVEIDLFQDEFIIDNVIKMVFNAEFKNEFDRDVSIQVDFLDDDNIEVHKFKLVFVESGNVNPPPYEDELLLEANSDIFNATRVRITASLEDIGTQMNPNASTEFEFKSSITLFVESEF